MKRGFTLVELLIALGIVVVLTIATSRAFISTVGYGQRLRDTRDAVAQRQGFEETVRDRLNRVYLDSDATNPNSYFIGGAAPSMPGQASLGTIAPTTGTAGASAAAPDTVIFTVAGDRLSGAVLTSTDDFETQNQTHGPVGGLTETGISLTAVGDASGQTGVFLRQQTPADNDPSQGGNERLLSPDVTELRFEFFDGTNWQATWDTRTQGQHRLPAAVRVTYRFRTDAADQIFVVRMPTSDATPLNPVTVTG